MCKFKVGDRVKCIDSKGNGTIIYGAEYIISGFVEITGSQYVTLKGKEKAYDYFFPERFELIATNVAEERVVSFKNGDVVEFLATTEWRKGTYIGPHPHIEESHVVISEKGNFYRISNKDIRKPKVKRAGYVGVYQERRQRPIVGMFFFDTEEEALKEYAKADYIAKMEWEE